MDYEEKMTLSKDLLLHLLATGLFKLASRLELGDRLSFPYELPQLERALNTMAFMQIQNGHPPISGLPALLELCSRPLCEWGIGMLEDLSPDHQLITFWSTGAPTEACEAWAVLSKDPVAEVVERQITSKMLSVGQQDQEIYVKIRRLMIEKPVSSHEELHRWQTREGRRKVGDILEQAYAEIPSSYANQGKVMLCPFCGDLLTHQETLRCETRTCRFQRGPTKPVRRSIDEGLMRLKRGLRRFVSAPGIAELTLARNLQNLGVQVELWPGCDRYDLRITFSDGEIWAVDVKDWAIPEKLALFVKPIPDTPHWDRAFFVFPDYRRLYRGYRRRFKARCDIGNCDALFAKELLREARRKEKGNA